MPQSTLSTFEKLPVDLRGTLPGTYVGFTGNWWAILFFLGDGGETGRRRGGDGAETGNRRVKQRRAAATSRFETLSCFGVRLTLHLLTEGREPVSRGGRTLGTKCWNRHLFTFEKLPVDLRGTCGGLTWDLQEIGGPPFFFGDGGETGDWRVRKRRAAAKGGGPPATSRSETLSCFGAQAIVSILVRVRR